MNQNLNPDYEPEDSFDFPVEPFESIPPERQDFQAERIARAIKGKIFDIEIQKNILNQYKQEIGATVDKLEEDIEKLSSELKLYINYRLLARDDKKKSVPLGKYTVGLRKSPDTVEIEDADKFCLEYSGSPFVRETVKLAPDIPIIKDHIKSTGEIPAGAKLIEGEDKIYVK